MPEFQFTVITSRTTLEEAKDAYLEGTVRSVDYAVTHRAWTDITADGQPLDDTAAPDSGHPDYQDMEYQQFLRDQAGADIHEPATPEPAEIVVFQ